MKKPRMSKEAKDTLESIALEHRHGIGICEGCADIWNAGFDVGVGSIKRKSTWHLHMTWLTLTVATWAIGFYFRP